jgi:hypothetical protein
MAGFFQGAHYVDARHCEMNEITYTDGSIHNDGSVIHVDNSIGATGRNVYSTGGSREVQTNNPRRYIMSTHNDHSVLHEDNSQYSRSTNTYTTSTSAAIKNPFRDGPFVGELLLDVAF